MSIISKLLENTDQRFIDKFKKTYPSVFKGWDRFANDYGKDPNRAYSVRKYVMDDKTEIFLVEDPGHGYFFAATGKHIGEEDGGIDTASKYRIYKEELQQKRKDRNFFNLGA